jgi:hypothetical protein
VCDQPLTDHRSDQVRRRPVVSAVVIMAVFSASLSLAPSALADSVDNLRAAIDASRAASSCGPFHSDPIVQHVAEVINKSVNDWLDHTATRAPIEDPLPGLNELGYRGSRGVTFGGASRKSDAESIKAAVLEGYAKIPDCSFTDIGVSMRQDAGTGAYLAAVVLAGP